MENKRINPRIETNKKFDMKIAFKGFLIISLLIGVFLNCIYGFGLPSSDVKCLEDVSHKYTENINSYLHKNKHVTSLITIFSSLCIDIIMVSICVHWVFKGKSWRLLICLFIFYLFRGIIQGLFQMRYPEGFIWDYPGLPSLAVSYLKTNDFFYSGHVGLPIIVACEFFSHGKFFMGCFSIFGCLVEFIVMTIMRGHYIIDLIFGIIIAHYIFIIVDRFIYLVDDSFISLKDKISKSNTPTSSTNYIKKSFREKLRERNEEPDCKASTSSSDDDVNKFY